MNARWDPGGSERLFHHPSQEKAVILLAVSAVAGSIVLGVPMLFDDPRSARLVTITALLGLCAVALAVRVYRRLDREATRLRFAPRLASLEEAALERRGEPGEASSGLRLVGVDLRGAVLAGADLRGADLTKARLDGADLRGADLTGADLKGTSLTEANLRNATLAKALYDEATVWPASIASPEKLGAINVGELL
jgi:hypothetical protein